MPNIVIPCTRCRYLLEFRPVDSLRVCPCCRAQTARPVSQGEGLEAYDRAVRQMHNGEFEAAARSFDVVLDRCSSEAEAYYGRALCHYGVQFVEDPQGAGRYPRVRSHRGKPMAEMSDFVMACKLAEEPVRQRYQAEAAIIDDTLAKFRRLMQGSSRYDAVICGGYANGQECGGGDGEAARELYAALTAQGYRVFLPCPGHDSDAEMDHALATARLMLLVCSEPERVNAPWLRIEWIGFLDLMDEDERRSLVPLCYGGMGGEQLPEEFRRRQLLEISMEGAGAPAMLAEVMQRFCGEPASADAPVQETAAPAADFAVEEQGEGCVITRYLGSGTGVTIPAEVNGQHVLGVGEVAFQGQTGLRSVCLPEGLEQIGERAFDGCSALERAVLPASLRLIGERAFDGCLCLQEIRVSAGNLFFRDEDGMLCTRAGRLLRFPAGRWVEGVLCVPEGVKEIAPGAFADCSGVEQIKLPASLRSVSGEAFCGCDSLRSISVHLGNYTLRSMDGVLFTAAGELVCYPPASERSAYNVPSDIVRIGRAAFFRCRSLREVRLPEELEQIGNRAFVSCSALEAIRIPGMQTGIASNALVDCSGAVLYVAEGSAAQRYADKAKRRAERIDSAGPARPGKPAGAVRVVKPGKATVLPPADYRITETESGCVVEKYCGTSAQVTVPPMICGRRVVALGMEAFAGTEVQTVRLPWAVTRIGERAFEGCDLLRALQVAEDNEVFCISGGVLLRQDGALVRCPPALEAAEYAVPDDVSSICDGAFSGCRALRTVRIPSGVTHIGAEAFRQCPDVVLQVAPDSPAHRWAAENGVRFVLQRAAEADPHADFSTADMDDGCVVTGYTGGAAELHIPGEIRGRRVIGLGSRALAHQQKLTALTLPEGMTFVGDGALSMCTALEEISLPATLQTISATALEGCRALRAIQVAPANPTMLCLQGVLCSRDGALLRYPAALAAERYDIPQSVRAIGAHAFGGCRALRELRVHGQVSQIGERAFEGCGELVLQVERDSFAHKWAENNGVRFALPADPHAEYTTEDMTGGCVVTGYTGQAEKLTIPQEIRGRRVLEVGSRAFSGQTTIREVVVPEGVTAIANEAFRMCSSLETISLPATLLTISATALLNCAALRRIDVAPANRRLMIRGGMLCSRDGVLLRCPEALDIDRLTVPEYIREIGDDAFSGCRKLRAIRLGHVSALGSRAFLGCGLRSVTVPEGVKTLQMGVFGYCVELQSLSLPASIEWIDTNAFINCAVQKYLVHENSFAHTCLKERKYPIELLPAVPEPVGSDAPPTEEPEELEELEEHIRKPSGAGNAKPCTPESDFSVREGANDEVIITGYHGTQTEVTVPERIGGRLVTAIAPGAFAKAHMEEITLPKGLRDIGREAFRGCRALRCVRLPADLAEIGRDAFRACACLEDINLPAAVKLGKRVFTGCRALPDEIRRRSDSGFFGSLF